MHSTLNLSPAGRVHMRKIFALALLLLSFQEALSLQTSRASPPYLYGKEAPDFSARSIDGAEYRLSSFRGRYVLLDFWAVGCAPCRDAMPALEAIHQDYSGGDLVILGIDIGEERLT